jgi:hypothetical protein
MASGCDVPVTCRLDSDEEVSIYEAGGVLQRFAQDFLSSNPTRRLNEAGTCKDPESVMHAWRRYGNAPPLSQAFQERR